MYVDLFASEVQVPFSSSGALSLQEGLRSPKLS